MSLEWMQYAACRTGYDYWYGHKNTDRAKAKTICNEQCPVLMECFFYAAERSPRTTAYGVWAGWGPGDWQKYRAKVRRIERAKQRAIASDGSIPGGTRASEADRPMPALLPAVPHPEAG